jgi:3-oxoacyl-[acyl-carrier protein] reductase
VYREKWSASVRNVIVTGGSRGLGLGIAKQLAHTGYRVITIARQSSDQLGSAMRETRPDTLHFRPFDLAEIGALPGFVKELRRDFGPLHSLVNNAGLGTSGVLAITPDALIDRLFRLNVISPITLTKYVVRSMMTDGGGSRIVNIASIVATTGYSGLSVYSGTKAALIGFTRSLARELGPLGITVNAVAPGFVDTDMTHGMREIERDRIVRRSALRRLPESDDIAHTVEFLISERAKNITGTVITVDGGNTV